MAADNLEGLNGVGKKKKNGKLLKNF